MSPDGGLLAAGGSSDPTLKIYNLKDGKLVKSVASDAGAIQTTYFDSTGKNVVISTPTQLKVYEIATEKMTTIDATIGYVHNVDFSRDGRFMCGHTRTGTLVIWNAKTWTEVRRINANAGPRAYSAFSPDGRYVVSSGRDNKLKLYDASSGQEVLTFASDLPASRVKFAADGTSLVVGGSDGSVRLYATSKVGRPTPVSSKQDPDDDPEK